MAHRTDSRPRPRAVARARIGLAVLAAFVLAGCAGNSTVVRRPIVDPAGTTWYGPARDDDRSALNSWAAGVGPAIVVHDAAGGGRPTDSLVLVSWNTAVGDGDIAALVRDVRAMHPGAPFALLIQEAFRDGPDVPFGGASPGVSRAGWAAARSVTISKPSPGSAASTSTTCRRCGTARQRQRTKIAATRSCRRSRSTS